MVIRWTGSEHALTPRQRPCPNIIIKYYPTIPYFEYISNDSFTLHTHVFAQFGSTAYRDMSIASQYNIKMKALDKPEESYLCDSVFHEFVTAIIQVTVTENDNDCNFKHINLLFRSNVDGSIYNNQHNYISVCCWFLGSVDGMDDCKDAHGQNINLSWEHSAAFYLATSCTRSYFRLSLIHAILQPTV